MGAPRVLRARSAVAREDRRPPDPGGPRPDAGERRSRASCAFVMVRRGMLGATRLLDDPRLPLRDALQSPDAVADLLDRYALPALIPCRELSRAAVLNFTYTPGR